MAAIHDYIGKIELEDPKPTSARTSFVQFCMENGLMEEQAEMDWEEYEEIQIADTEWLRSTKTNPYEQDRI